MTEVGGINYYDIEPDIILLENRSKTSGELLRKLHDFPRKASNLKDIKNSNGNYRSHI